LPEPHIVIVAPASRVDNSEASLAMLREINLPGVLKYVVTYGKLDTAEAAKTINVETGYPPEPPLLETLSAWALPASSTDDRLSDGFDLHCLLRILDKLKVEVSYAVILRESTGFEQGWPALKTAVDGRQFVSFAQGLPQSGESARNVVFDLTDLRNRVLLDFTWELYLSGMSYALSSYSLDRALATAARSRAILESGEMPSFNSRSHDA
jgi:hypothetical protein